MPHYGGNSVLVQEITCKLTFRHKIRGAASDTASLLGIKW